MEQRIENQTEICLGCNHCISNMKSRETRYLRESKRFSKILLTFISRVLQLDVQRYFLSCEQFIRRE